MVKQIKCTVKNINQLNQTLLNQLEDNNGRGEFDKHTDLLRACEITIENMEECD